MEVYLLISRSISLTTPLGHDSIWSLIDVRERESSIVETLHGSCATVPNNNHVKQLSVSAAIRVHSIDGSLQSPIDVLHDRLLWSLAVPKLLPEVHLRLVQYCLQLMHHGILGWHENSKPKPKPKPKSPPGHYRGQHRGIDIETKPQTGAFDMHIFSVCQIPYRFPILEGG